MFKYDATDFVMALITMAAGAAITVMCGGFAMHGWDFLTMVLT